MSNIGKLFLYYCKAPRFYLRGWLWKYLIFELLIFLCVMLVCFGVSVLVCSIWVVPWAEKQQLSPFLTKLLKNTLHNIHLLYDSTQNQTTHVKMGLLAEFLSITFTLIGLAGGFALQELLNSPLNQKISYHIEKIIGGKNISSEPPNYAGHLWKNFKRYLKLGLFAILIALVLMVLLGIPYTWVQIPMSTILLLGIAYWMGCSYINDVLERRNLESKAKWKLLLRHKVTLVLFGLLCLGALYLCSLQIYFLPLWIMLANPIQIVVGTTLAVKVVHPQKKQTTYIGRLSR